MKVDIRLTATAAMLALFSLSSHGQIALIGAEDTVYGFSDVYKSEHGFVVKNTGTEPATVHVKREILQASPGFEQSFCWGLSCYTPAVDESVESVTIQPGMTESSFLLDFYPNGGQGSLKVRISFLAQSSNGKFTETMDFVFLGIDVPSISGSTTYCAGGNSVLAVPGHFDSYLWSEGSTTASIPATAGTYEVEVSLHGTAKTTASVVVAESDALTPIVPNEIGLCAGNTTTIDAGPAFDSYTWNGVPGESTFEATSELAEVELTVTLGACSGTKTIEVVDGTPATPMIYSAGMELVSVLAEQYQWYFNNEPLPGETSQNIQPEEDGDYMVEVWNEFGCSAISEPFAYTSLGIQAGISVLELKLFPNPASDHINIVSARPIGCITVFDLTGKQVLSQSLNSTGTQVDLSQLDKGIYLLEAGFKDGGKMVEKIIVK